MISFKKTFAYMVLSPYSFVLLFFNLYLEKWDSCSWFYLVESNTYMYKYTQNQECSERILLQQKILWYTTHQCRIREKIDGGHWPIALRDKALGSEKWKTKKKKKPAYMLVVIFRLWKKCCKFENRQNSNFQNRTKK